MFSFFAPGTRRPGAAPVLQSPEMASSALLTLPHLFLPPETTAKAHAHVSSLLGLLTTLELLHIPFSHGMVHPLLLGIISNKLSSQ